MFKRLLIANRGEIACRVVGTARRMGLETVAVYSEADQSARHAQMADRAVPIGSAAAAQSYLCVERILAAARETRADAIHPGYGFLSENAEFAQACADAGVVFVGPSPSSIRAMGLKDRAKALMQEAGVPVVPGYFGNDQSPGRLEEEASLIGYPVLIKAVAGGGGKGMRRVESPAEFHEALEGAKREAVAAFKDDRVLIEKYIASPRHIEVQIFADTHGAIVHLFERDCSLQRRHQKVIEEAPAPGIPAAMRKSMCEAAIKAARIVEYVGAGTIEFIADASQGLKADRFWFMEMNTRLQVEHPVTEAITGIDLVEWQLRVAAGERLPKKQEDIAISGNAIEARLYAEDPRRGFLPSTGLLQRLKLTDELRVDSGVREGDSVNAFYDPMIAKVICHKKTRTAAANGLADALAAAEIAGVRTNNGLLIACLRDPEFQTGRIDTGYIERHLDRFLKVRDASAIAAAAANFMLAEASAVDASSDPWAARDGFRLGAPAGRTVEFAWYGKRLRVDPDTAPASQLHVVRLADRKLAVFREGETFELSEYDPLEAEEAIGSVGDRIVSPMPGKLTRVLVQEGQSVTRGQALAVLEAMKMEHTLTAPAELKIESISAAAGDQVVEGQVIIRFKRSETVK
ncbi:MAG: biotin/lipoyl-binding protein [Alphaproteobacteria bacterium]|nr:biotin/lipoyl-binding protein [Alphaproteobacteria bacterium]